MILTAPAVRTTPTVSFRLGSTDPCGPDFQVTSHAVTRALSKICLAPSTDNASGTREAIRPTQAMTPIATDHFRTTKPTICVTPSLRIQRQVVNWRRELAGRLSTRSEGSQHVSLNLSTCTRNGKDPGRGRNRR